MDHDQHDLNGHQLTSVVVSTSDHDSAPSVSHEVDPRDGNQSSAEINKAEDVNQIRTGQATGPRTKRGKQISSHNAIRHGIFSEVILEGRESKTRYRSICVRLLEYFRPQGGIEELLVEELAMLLWRRRRVVKMECADIEKESEFVVDNAVRQRVKELRDRELVGGILLDGPSSICLKKALQLLEDLRGLVKERGFDRDHDFRTLIRLYGSGSGEEIPDGLFTYYQWCSKASELYVEEGGKNPRISPENMRAQAIRYIDAEIQLLQKLEKWVKELENRRLDWNTTSSLVPSQVTFERIIRYEAHLSREFDRTLNQLERLQRMRRGQPVPPPINLNVSS